MLSVGVSPRLAILALFLLVVPAAVTALFLTQSSVASVRDGAQPGGLVEVRARLPADAEAGDAFEGLVVELVGVDAEGRRRTLAEARANPGGAVLFEAPSLHGHYELVARDSRWLPAAQPFSLVGVATPQVIELPLRPAARLTLAFTRRDGRTIRGGDWNLRGESGGSWFSVWARTQLERGGSFEGPELVVEGLPPMRAELVVRIDGSERVELVLDLAAGENRHSIGL